MAAYIFLRWVLVLKYSSQIRHFLWNNAAPNVKKFLFLSFSLSVVCCSVDAYTFACKTQDARRMNSWSPYLDCTALTRKRNARFARRGSCVHTADCESTNKNGNSLMLGAALFHENDGFVKNIWRSKPTAEKSMLPWNVNLLKLVACCR